MDLATRGTHLLFKAAVEAGVKRFIYGSTLEIFGNYPDDIYISEFYKPLPKPEIHQLTRYLGELTCREFARTYLITDHYVWVRWYWKRRLLTRLWT